MGFRAGEPQLTNWKIVGQRDHTQATLESATASDAAEKTNIKNLGYVPEKNNRGYDTLRAR